jgi:hypothetical protein
METDGPTCVVCKKKAQHSKYPGPLPYAGSWCDVHYEWLQDLCRSGFYCYPMNEREMRNMHRDLFHWHMSNDKRCHVV